VKRTEFKRKRPDPPPERPTIGHGVEAGDEAYRGAHLATTTDLTRTEAIDMSHELPSKAPNDIPVAERRAVEARSGGWCEARVSARCTGTAVHKHHRKLRRHRDHRAINLLDVCTFCHDVIHAHPADAYARGLLLRSTDDPAAVPIRYT
jgi:hypothetical protein